MITKKYHSIFFLFALMSLFTLSAQAQNNCQAAFSYEISDNTPGLVFFADSSTSDTAIQSWWWLQDGAIPPFAFTQNPQRQFGEGEFEVCLIITAVDGCRDTTCQMINICLDCVWPGDANSDGVANNRDILSVGAGLGFAGAARTDTTINWAEYTAADFFTSNGNGVNRKHQDCNGNGEVDLRDTIAVIQNYGLTHQKAAGGTNCDSSNIPLAMSFSADTFFVSESHSVTISLGNDLNPANGVHGIAFSLLYDNVNIDTSSLNVRFDTAFGSINSLITFKKFFNDAGRIDIAVSGTNRSNRTVNGPIMHFDFVMEENLVQKGPVTETTVTTGLVFEIVDEYVMNANDAEVYVCSQKDSVVGAMVVIGIDEPEFNAISFFPNPAKDQITLDNSKGQIVAVELINLLGEVVLAEAGLMSGALTIDLSDLTDGMYIVRAESKSGDVVSSRLHKQSGK